MLLRDKVREKCYFYVYIPICNVIQVYEISLMEVVHRLGRYRSLSGDQVVRAKCFLI